MLTTLESCAPGKMRLRQYRKRLIPTEKLLARNGGLATLPGELPIPWNTSWGSHGGSHARSAWARPWRTARAGDRWPPLGRPARCLSRATQVVGPPKDAPPRGPRPREERPAADG